MAKYLPLPDGSSLKVPDDMPYEEAMAKAKAKFPDLFAAPGAGAKTGLMADVMGAGANLLSLGRTGLAALTGGHYSSCPSRRYSPRRTPEKIQVRV